MAVNIGSTRTGVAAFVDGKQLHAQRVDNSDAEGLRTLFKETQASLNGASEAVAILASVNPPATVATERILIDLGLEVRRVERDLPIPIGRQLDPEAIVGEDRLLNAAAAYDVLKQACIVADAGTAITIDLVDGQGTFHGGVIAPGASLMLTALHEHTASLPQVTPQRPVEPVGHNTGEAMKAGVYHALRGMLRETVEQYAQVLGTFAPVVVTGGDGLWLFEDHDLVDRIVPDLTFFGMQVTLQAALTAPE